MTNDERIQELMDQRDACERAFEHITRAMEIFDTIKQPVSSLWFGVKASLYTTMENALLYEKEVDRVHTVFTDEVE